MVRSNFKRYIVPKSPKMMLIDGDPAFDRGFVAAAKRKNLRIEARTDIVDIYRNPPRDSDILVLGFDLGRVNGIQLSRYLEHHARAKFVILMIQGGLDQLQVRLPACVKAVVSRDLGCNEILEVAKSLFRCYNSTEI